VMTLIEGDWSSTHVLVIGDMMLDRYIWGEVERISPEAPVPIVRALRQNERPGGAANVAMNVVGLGAKATLSGFCGEDAERLCLHQALESAGVKCDSTVLPGFSTTSKLRILAGKQQILRLDREQTSGYPQPAYAALIEKVEANVPAADVVVLSDYAKGALSETVCERVIETARRQGIPVLVDPKQRSFARYGHANTICPNLAELSAATGISIQDQNGLFAAGQKMVAELGLDCLTATMGDKGIALLRADSQFVAPAKVRQVFDVSGAGDTVIATLALAMASRLEMETAIQLANVAAGIVVGKVGTVPVSRDELLTTLTPEIGLHAEEKVLSLDALMVRVSAWRSAGQSIVFTNGCFDVLHIGHVALLEQARREGDRLIVAINSDSSVRTLKGLARPVVGEAERARIMAALGAVDAVIVFADVTPLPLVEALRPDVIVKGGDYSEASVVGSSEVRSWGGRVKIVPTVEGFSTSKLIAKVNGKGELG
jgi:D-beta-D-heptose 7-phosphate kinase / D-beta-D-heptose 1-phosphate adenosyltransferase